MADNVIPTPSAPPSKESTLYLGVAVATTLGHAATLTLPFEIGAMVDGLKLDVGSAGLLASAEFVPYTAVQFLLAPYGARLPLRLVATLGTLIIVGASLMSAATQNLPLFILARIATGLGFGLVYAIASIAGVRARSPERAYGLGLGSTTVAYAILLFALPRGATVTTLLPNVLHAHSGVFIVVAGFALFLLPLMRTIPSAPTGALFKSPTIVPRTIAVRPALLAIVVVTLFSVAVRCVFTYLERKGRSLGIDAATIGTFMSIIYVVTGLSGSGGAAILGRRWGITPPLVVGLVLVGFACLGTAIAASSVELWCATAASWIIWFFLYGYLIGLGAALDKYGRLATVLGAMYLSAQIVAAPIGGFLLDLGGFKSIGWLALLLCNAAAIGAWMLRKSIDHPRAALATTK